MFAALAPAAAAAGAGLLLGLAVAAAVAFCNAASSAQYPSSGGAYVYGRERLGEWPGFLAGWCFLVGKTASCAAMALTFAAYALPGAPQRVVALAAVLVLAAVDHLGVSRTARVSRVLLALVLISLAVVVVACAAGGAASGARIAEGGLVAHGGWAGVLESAQLRRPVPRTGRIERRGSGAGPLPEPERYGYSTGWPSRTVLLKAGAGELGLLGGAAQQRDEGVLQQRVADLVLVEQAVQCEAAVECADNAREVGRRQRRLGVSLGEPVSDVPSEPV